MNTQTFVKDFLVLQTALPFAFHFQEGCRPEHVEKIDVQIPMPRDQAMEELVQIFFESSRDFEENSGNIQETLFEHSRIVFDILVISRFVFILHHTYFSFTFPIALH